MAAIPKPRLSPPNVEGEFAMACTAVDSLFSAIYEPATARRVWLLGVALLSSRRTLISDGLRITRIASNGTLTVPHDDILLGVVLGSVSLVPAFMLHPHKTTRFRNTERIIYAKVISRSLSPNSMLFS